jgi:oxygen-independent coproporphyrinogen-3 oxidase
VTRISVGAQSFHPAHLKTLERWHDPENVGRAVELARGAGIERQSIDLIFAIPGQTLEDWDHDLRTALALGLDHLSCYALTFEPHTAMTARLARGEFPRADEDLEADMFEHTVRVLRAAGLDRYEVSNFAVPGRECAHNMVYWRQGQWLAAGPSASAHVGGHRWKNTPRLDDYLTRDIDGLAPFVDHEPPDARRALCECILTGLRTREGLDWQGLVRAGESLAPGAAERLDRVASRQHAMGCAQVRDGRLALTDSGFLVANRVILDLVRALDALR